MMKTIFRTLLILSCVFSMAACSSSKNDQTDDVNSPRPVPESSVMAKQESQFPMDLLINAETADSDVSISIQVVFNTALPGTPVLEIVPSGDTVVDGISLSETLPEPTEPGTVTRMFRISGTSPAIKATVSVRGAGAGMQISASWPKEVKPMSHTSTIAPLPAPIEVEGAVIDSGVEVHP